MPTAKVVAAILFIDYFSIQTIGVSPAFLKAGEIDFSLPLSIGYIAVILSLVVLPLMVPLILIATILQYLCAQILLFPIKRIRILKAAIKFYLRKNYIRTEFVRRYAKQNGDDELLEKLNKNDRALASPTYLFPCLAFFALNLVVFSSSEQNPNFMMRVCSTSVPTGSCSLYNWLLALAYLQMFLVLALQGLVEKLLRWFPISELDVEPSIVMSAKSSPSSNDKLFKAMKTWMRG